MSGLICAVILLSVSVVWIIGAKEDQPWSRLPGAWARFRAKPPSPGFVPPVQPSLQQPSQLPPPQNTVTETNNTTDGVKVHVHHNAPKDTVTAKVGHSPQTAPTTAPPIEADVNEMLTSGRLSQGWTLHKRGDVWTIYFIVNTDQLNEPLASAMRLGDMPVTADMAQKAISLWTEVRQQVSPPKPVETAYGIVKGQELTEHLSHSTQKPTILDWTYEIMRNGQNITPRPQLFEHIPMSNLTTESRKTMGEFDAMAVHTINKQYIDATVDISK